MHKRETVRGNKIHKILGEFEIQTDNLTPIKRADLGFIKKVRWSVHMWPQSEDKKSDKRNE